MLLDEFNSADAEAAASVVGVWAAIPAWVDAVVAGRPYGSVDALAAHAGALAESVDAGGPRRRAGPPPAHRAAPDR